MKNTHDDSGMLPAAIFALLGIVLVIISIVKLVDGNFDFTLVGILDKWSEVEIPFTILFFGFMSFFVSYKMSKSEVKTVSTHRSFKKRSLMKA